MKQLVLLGVSLLAISACAPQAPPPPASVAQPVGTAPGSPTNTTAAFLNSGLNRVERRQQVMEFTISPRDNLILLRSLDGTFARKLDLPSGVRVEAPDVQRFLLLPGAAPPRVRVQLASERGQRRIVTLDPITGVPSIERPANP